MFELNSPVSSLKGVGEKRRQVLEKAGIHTVGELLMQLPVRYEDRTRTGGFTQPPEATPVTIRLKVIQRGTVRRLRRGMSLFVLPVSWKSPEGGEVRGEAVWFNQPYMASHFETGATYLMYARVVKKDGQPYRIYSPKFAPIEQQASFMRILPVYSKREGMAEKTLQGLIEQALSQLDQEFSSDDGSVRDVDYLPEHIREDCGLVDYTTMIRSIHFPEDHKALGKARERLKFEEGLRVASGIEQIKRAGFGSKAVITDTAPLGAFLKSLPFTLTDAQQKVLDEILADLGRDTAMNRMVQGDVGSGKTILAVACAFLMARNGYQTAYMAPTEILAEQHARTFTEYLSPFDIDVVLLTGSMKAKEAEEVREKIRNGQAQVVVGTHALIQEKTDFYNPGLVVTDEQHRFGVRQRGQLSNKGGCHTLVMSATPIPRTTALTLFGDLDLSVIDELPAGRKKIKTSFFTSKKTAKILGFMEEEIQKGHQAFIVCPFIEKSEEMPDVADVERTYKNVKKFAGDRFKVGKLHGEMTGPQKEKTIRDYTAGKIDLLVVTSIIEVGIDVRGATVMMILSADRFGLAQLHQLRGRIGRNDLQSYCFLVSDNVTETTVERMKVLVNHHNGQEIAMEDYRLRGPGEYFGVRQHGYGGLKLLDPLAEPELFERCTKVAWELYDSGRREDMILKDRLLREFDQFSREISMT